MRKVKLDLESLTVMSFDTSDAPRHARGTVQARMPHHPAEETDHTCETAAESCRHSDCPNINNSCGYSCDCVTTTGDRVFCH